MSKYVQAAQKLVKESGYGGGMNVVKEYEPLLGKLVDKAKQEGDDEAAKQIGSLYEALYTTHL